MGLVRRLGLAGLVGLGTIGGCVSPEEQLAQGSITREEYHDIKQRRGAFLLSLIGGGIAARGIQTGKEWAIPIGQAVAAQGAAQAGRSQVIYNAPPQQQYSVPREQIVPIAVDAEPVNNPENRPHSFIHPRFGEVIVGTFNYAFDFDNNGFIRYPNEYRGIKDYFTSKEKISVSLGSQTLMPDLSYRLLNQNGNVTDSFSVKDKGAAEAYGICKIYNSGMENNDKLPSGDYHALWYSGDEFLAQWRFSVKEK